MPSWTAASEVRIYLKGAGTPMTDAEIEHILNDCEGFWAAALKLTSTNWTFNNAKPSHLSVRAAATIRAAQKVIAATPQSHMSLDHASLSLDLYRDMEKDLQGILNQIDVTDFVIDEA